MRPISLKLPEDLLAELDSEAKSRGVTKSSIVRESLAKELRKQSPSGAISAYDLARDLAGTLKGLPQDLADNPEYMEGFASDRRCQLVVGGLRSDVGCKVSVPENGL